jgi:hypothetical protein
MQTSSNEMYANHKSIPIAQALGEAEKNPMRMFLRDEFLQRCAILDAILRKQRGRLAVAAYRFGTSLSICGESAAKETAAELELAADTIDFGHAFALFEKLESEVRDMAFTQREFGH